MATQKQYFFAGIGGSGMSALADIARRQGAIISGSDRGCDQGATPEKFATLARAGITLHPQDGSGITPAIDAVIVSSAVEETIPDIARARALGVPILKRAELLAGMFNAARGIGLAGTSGKTTTTGMTGWVLHALGLNPTIVNGGIMPNFAGTPESLLGNAVAGGGPFVAEMDESDGTIALFNPDVAVLNNVTLDHKPIAVIEPLFHAFLARANRAVINLDDPHAAAMASVNPQTLTYAIGKANATFCATHLTPCADGIGFTLQDGRDGAAYPCTLRVPGRHNVSNALAALAVAAMLEQDMAAAVAALAGFRGIKRRLETLGVAGGVCVMDDFAHNPDKIAASLQTLTAYPGRVLVLFQPHGFGPMKMMREGLVDSFARGLRPQDGLVMPEIFYAGGTVARDISSNDLIGDIKARGANAHFTQTRDEAGAWLLAQAKPGDRIIIMGARDDTLSEFGLALLEKMRPRELSAARR